MKSPANYCFTDHIYVCVCVCVCMHKQMTDIKLLLLHSNK